MTSIKVVVALYDYHAVEQGDLTLRTNEEYDVIDESQEHWWLMRDKAGHEGYAPSNYVQKKGNISLQQYDWYLGDVSRHRVEGILTQQESEGCFIVRNSATQPGMYTLSVYSKKYEPPIRHYHIKKDAHGMHYISPTTRCQSVPDLIYLHQHNPAGLMTRLREPPTNDKQAPTTAGFGSNKWEIDPGELNLLEELGTGQFGIVRRAKLRRIDVAVKMMKDGSIGEEAFIEEAKVMTKLQHENIVQLYGVCSKKRPIYIVTEYLKYGTLLQYLRNKQTLLISKSVILLDMCLQVCKGMAYLEEHQFIHRDLAARNCLVGSYNVVKVADFGLTRFVLDDEYNACETTKFPIKWASPEVLEYMTYSSKSDVWAFGVLMWEVFTCGKIPYGRMKHSEVVSHVQQGRYLENPRNCLPNIYKIMCSCWTYIAERRPSFGDLAIHIKDLPR
ncbi:unnamed protein product [Meganyctiphanes norvegica]|uniref:Tyrosine-protein kinase n=1 Tax=Meganyctiphanes norvegica TaxID=48144 RepID=A0AAV2PNI8_MEGNR